MLHPPPPHFQTWFGLWVNTSEWLRRRMKRIQTKRVLLSHSSAVMEISYEARSTSAVPLMPRAKLIEGVLNSHIFIFPPQSRSVESLALIRISVIRLSAHADMQPCLSSLVNIMSSKSEDAPECEGLSLLLRSGTILSIILLCATFFFLLGVGEWGVVFPQCCYASCEVEVHCGSLCVHQCTATT